MLQHGKVGLTISQVNGQPFPGGSLILGLHDRAAVTQAHELVFTSDPLRGGIAQQPGQAIAPIEFIAQRRQHCIINLVRYADQRAR